MIAYSIIMFIIAFLFLAFGVAIYKETIANGTEPNRTDEDAPESERGRNAGVILEINCRQRHGRGFRPLHVAVLQITVSLSPGLHL